MLGKAKFWARVAWRVLHKSTSQSASGETPTESGMAYGDVNLNFVRYCKEYLHQRCDLTSEQAQIVVLDPELGREIDQVKGFWAFHILRPEDDPDEYLVGLKFDDPVMTQINDLLDSYAGSFPANEQRVREYLRSIDHPLAES
jgi:hypothetical protein